MRISIIYLRSFSACKFDDCVVAHPPNTQIFLRLERMLFCVDVSVLPCISSRSILDTSCIRTCPDSKAVLDLLSSRFEVQGEQPASRKHRTYTEKQSFNVVKPTRGERIVPTLSRNISGHPRNLIYWRKSKSYKIVTAQ